jgi:hypothetical protein
MNPYYGYQLYQDQRTKTRTEILAGDARPGRQAAAVLRGSRALAGPERDQGHSGSGHGPRRMTVTVPAHRPRAASRGQARAATDSGEQDRSA